MSRWIYILLSIGANVILWSMIAQRVKALWKKKDRFYFIVIAVGILVLFFYYIYSIQTRRMIYYFDYARYFQLQGNLSEFFGQGVMRGIKELVKSVWFQDYNLFVCLFGGVFYELVPIKTVDACILEYFIWAVLPVLVLAAVFCYNLLVYFGVKNAKCTFTVTWATMIFCPMLHCVALKGMPDLFGLAFALLIVIYTMDYDFHRIDWKRIFLIAGNAVALFITRRWYAYWLVAFLSSFILLNFLKTWICHGDRKGFLKTAGALVAGGLLLALLALTPLFMHILGYNYSEHYMAYKFGGFGTEISRQIIFLGKIPFFLMVCGIVAGLCSRSKRYYTVLMLLTLGISMTLFLQVQNTAEHQVLIYYLPYMVFLSILYAETIGRVEKTGVKAGLATAAGAVVALNVMSSCGISVFEDSLWSKLSLKPIVRDDYDEIRQVSGYLQDLIEREKAQIYIIPHHTEYNPDVFRNAYVPGSLDAYISYGAGVFGTHKFPVEFLEADYVLTSDPVLDSEEDGIVHNLSLSMEEMLQKKELELVESFKFEEQNIAFSLYRRVKPIESSDIVYLEELFSGKYEQFPELYAEVLAAYKEKMQAR